MTKKERSSRWMVCEHKVGALFIGKQTLVSCFLFLPSSTFLFRSEVWGGKGRDPAVKGQSLGLHTKMLRFQVSSSQLPVSQSSYLPTYFSIFYKAEWTGTLSGGALPISQILSINRKPLHHHQRKKSPNHYAMILLYLNIVSFQQVL